jgi:hypothetical protein
MNKLAARLLDMLKKPMKEKTDIKGWTASSLIRIFIPKVKETST